MLQFILILVVIGGLLEVMRREAGACGAPPRLAV